MVQGWKKGLSVLLALCMMLSAGAMALAEAADGVYQGAAQGMNGPVKVEVTVEGGAISNVEVLEHSETPGISDPAVEQIPAAIVEKNAADVEAVSGATVTSNAIMQAVTAALSGETQPEETEVVVPFEQTDVIVIGAGIAGLSASVRAAELGANVLVLEQSATVGGSGKLAGGSLVGVNTLQQKENGIEDSVELLLEDFATLGGEGNNNPVLAKAFAERCGEAVDWLDTYVGVDFGTRVPTTGGYIPLNVNRVHYAVPENGDVSLSSGQGGSGYVKALSEKLNEAVENGNACLMLNTRVTEVLSEDGVVTGVKAVNSFGERTYEAPSVIIATGGYGGNEAWLKEYNFTNVLTTTPATATGDGYNFARELGAAFSGMDWCSAYAGGIYTGTFTKTLAANLFTYLAPIWVNEQGERFIDEPTADSTQKSDAWTNASNNVVFVIYNEAMVENPADMLYGAADAQATFDELLAEGEVLFKADTIEELAGKMGVDEAALTATVEAYNAACAGDAEDPFGRTDNMIALSDGPFYAVKTIPYVMLTAGGPSMNEHAQLLREDGSVIVGAYQCGEIVGSNNIAGHSSVGGMAHGNCVTWGMIAAESAVEHASEVQ